MDHDKTGTKRKTEEKHTKEGSSTDAGASLKHSSGHAWNKAIKELLANRKADELLGQMKGGTAIMVKSDDSLYTALIVMTESKIHSVPIIDSKVAGKCVGFVDTLDVMMATIEILESAPTQEHFHKLSSKKKQTEEEEDEDTAIEMMEQIVIQQVSAKAISDFSHEDAFSAVTEETNLLEIGKNLIKHGKQRVAVQDSHGKFLGVITQSGFAEYCSQELIEELSKQKKTVKDLPLSKVVTISPSTTAIDAFKKMGEEKVPAMALVSNHGLLLGVVSASDFTLWNEWVASGQVFRFTDFAALKSNIKDYLETSRAQRDIPKRPPLTCTKNSKVEDVIGEMLYHNVHSLFVVDDSNNPIGRLTFADIISELVA